MHVNALLAVVQVAQSFKVEGVVKHHGAILCLDAQIEEECQGLVCLTHTHAHRTDSSSSTSTNSRSYGAVSVC